MEKIPCRSMQRDLNTECCRNRHFLFYGKVHHCQEAQPMTPRIEMRIYPSGNGCLRCHSTFQGPETYVSRNLISATRKH
jgi:hypothetical protein